MLQHITTPTSEVLAICCSFTNPPTRLCFCCIIILIIYQTTVDIFHCKKIIYNCKVSMSRWSFDIYKEMKIQVRPMDMLVQGEDNSYLSGVGVFQFCKLIHKKTSYIDLETHIQLLPTPKSMDTKHQSVITLPVNMIVVNQYIEYR